VAPAERVDGSTEGAAAQEAVKAPTAAPEVVPTQPDKLRAAVRVVRTGELPSVLLLAAADELEASHNAHRVKMLEDALKRLETAVLDVHDASKRFKPIIDYLFHPHISTSHRLPAHLLTWGSVASAEAVSVHAEFKRLAAESEKRQREEAMREEAAAEERAQGKSRARAAGGRNSPPPASGVQPPSSPQPPAAPAAGAPALAPSPTTDPGRTSAVDGATSGMSASQSMPAL